MKVLKDIEYVSGGTKDQVLDMYLPDGDSFPAIVYFHGGGLQNGDKGGKGHQAIGSWLANRGIAFVSANYRMYPMASYPDFLKDGAAAVAWVKSYIGEYGGDGRVFVGGSSAGGYMSMMLCFDRRYLAPYLLLPEQIDGYIHDAGQPSTHFNVLRERGVDSRRVVIDEAAPIYHIGIAKEYAPMMFIVADNDMKNRYEQTLLAVSTIKHFGYDMSKVELKLMENYTHTSYVSEINDNGDSLFGIILQDFVSRH